MKKPTKNDYREVEKMCYERGLGKLFYILNLSTLQENGIEEVRRRVARYDYEMPKAILG